MSAKLHSWKDGDTHNFTLFPILPTEIWDTVWEKACQFPNIIETEKSYDAYRTRNRDPGERWNPGIPGRTPYKVPSVLHTCAQSRQVALRMYRLVRGNPSNDQKLYINCDVDIMLHPDWYSIWVFKYRRSYSPPSVHSQVVDIYDIDWRYIIVRHTISVAYHRVMRTYMQACSPFLHPMKCVIIEKPESDSLSKELTEKFGRMIQHFEVGFGVSSLISKSTINVLTTRQLDEFISGISSLEHKSPCYTQSCNGKISSADRRESFTIGMRSSARIQERNSVEDSISD
ncbi:hypothetical protein ACMFMG_001529 [Clarireedia jacksonii]